MTRELCYLLEELPDLSLDRYASLGGGGVDAVLERHVAFLRQWNRKGVLTDVSLHLLYYYNASCEAGKKLSVLLLVRGQDEHLENVPKLIAASPLSAFYRFTDRLPSGEPLTLDAFEKQHGIADHTFRHLSALSKKEVFIRPSYGRNEEGERYYTIPAWETNEDGRLYDLAKLMGGLDQTLLYRVDVYPVERSGALRNALRKPLSVLRQKQGYGTGTRTERDYEAEAVLRAYTEMQARFDESPHFLVDLFVFGNDRNDTEIVLDAAGAEALTKGSYTISDYDGAFSARSFLDSPPDQPLIDRVAGVCLKGGKRGLTIAAFDPLGENGAPEKLCELPTLFTLEELAPFFRLPALYDGETLQLPKETAPKTASRENALHLGVDENGYPVFFPLKNLPKHAFLAGVPGSGKTNAMLHIASTLYAGKDAPRIPFLILEPAKREYRALANQPGMEELYLFSPNADMRFPLHINPFEFPKGLLLAEHINRLVAVFEGAFPLENPMPFLLDTAIEAVYRALGWTPETVYTDETKLPFPTMSMLYVRLEQELLTTKYSDEIRGNLESALKVRIGSLLRREMGDVFDAPFSTIAPEEWLRISAVVELESMGVGPANFLTLMLCTLIRESLKVDPVFEGEHARHVLFIEEAHNLIGPEAEEVSGNDANPKLAATAFIVRMLAEVRALKEAIVIADQLPTVMAAEVIKNTGLKLGLRITSADDRALLGGTMAANNMQIEQMATYRVGEALVSYEGLLRPFKARIKEWRGKGLPGDENYIEDEAARKKAVTALPDEALTELMRDRPVYRRTCERSFLIHAERLLIGAQAASKRMQKAVSFAERLSREALGIKQTDEELERRMARLDPLQAFGGDPAEYEKLVSEVKALDARRDALESVIAKSTFLGDMNAGLGALTRILQAKARWSKLGIDANALASNDADGGECAEQAKRVLDACTLLSLRCQQLYIVSREFLPRPNETRADIHRVCRILRMECSI